MKQSTRERLDRLREEAPILFASGVDEAAVQDAERALKVQFGPAYRAFLLEYGGAMVGPWPIVGLATSEVMDDRDTVVELTTWYRKDGWYGVEDWVIVSADHGGNPIGIAPSGEIWVSDHDFGGLYRLAGSFEEFLEEQLTKSEKADGLNGADE